MNNVGEAFFSSPIDPTDLSKDWGRSDNDQRHRLVANGNYQVRRIQFGGTLLASTLAKEAAKGREPFASATFFAAQKDFTKAGDLQLFIDDAQLKALEFLDRGAHVSVGPAGGRGILAEPAVRWPGDDPPYRTESRVGGQ